MSYAVDWAINVENQSVFCLFCFSLSLSRVKNLYLTWTNWVGISAINDPGTRRIARASSGAAPRLVVTRDARVGHDVTVSSGCSWGLGVDRDRGRATRNSWSEKSNASINHDADIPCNGQCASNRQSISRFHADRARNWHWKKSQCVSRSD